MSLLKVNSSKNKVQVFEGNGLSGCNIILNGEELSVMEKFRYLGVKFQ